MVMMYIIIKESLDLEWLMITDTYLLDCRSGISVGMVLSNHPFFQAFDHMVISFSSFFGDLI